MQEIINRIKKSEILSEGGRSVYYFFHHYIIGQYSILSKKDWSVEGINVIADCKNNNARWYRIIEDKTFYNKELQRFIERPALISEIIEELDLNSKEMSLEFKDLPLNKKTNTELISFLESFGKYYLLVLRPSAIIRIIDLAIMWRLKENLSNADEVMRVGSFFDKPSYILQEEIDLLKLFIDNKGIVKKTDLVLLLEKYAWTEQGYFNEKPKTVTSYLEKIANLSLEIAQKRFEEIRENQNKLRSDRDKMLSSLDEDNQTMIKLAGYSTYAKDHYKYSVNRLIYYIEPLLTEIASRLSKTVEYVKDLSPNEIEKLLKGKNVDELSIIARRNHYVSMNLDNKYLLFIGEDADLISKEIFTTKEVRPDILKGRVASVGQARGIAKIVMNPSQFDKVNEGDILIVINTSPDFTPILKKVSAIVSEEGGLTAHVSVVSREMKIPAVVGVNYVTSIIKDGDLVEVDANKGIVKIIKRNE